MDLKDGWVGGSKNAFYALLTAIKIFHSTIKSVDIF
jgi:hypothetical protein